MPTLLTITEEFAREYARKLRVLSSEAREQAFRGRIGWDYHSQRLEALAVEFENAVREAHVPHSEPNHA